MYNIQLTSSLSGINVHNLRAWERRYNAVSPERDSVGRRLYSKEHVEKLYLLNQLVKEGTAIRHIASNSSSELLSLAEKKGLNINLDFEPEADEDKELHLSFNAIKLGLNFKKFDIINHEINKVLENYDLKKVVFDLLIPTLYLIREKLDRKEISLDEKQTITTLIKYYLRKKVFQNNVDLTKSSYLVASPKGDSYELQSLISSLILSAHDKQVIYLGPNVDSDTIRETAAATSCDNVIIWGSCKWNQTRGQELAHFYEEVARELPENVSLNVACNGSAPFEFFVKDESINILKSFEELNSALS